MVLSDPVCLYPLLAECESSSAWLGKKGSGASYGSSKRGGADKYQNGNVHGAFTSMSKFPSSIFLNEGKDACMMIDD